MSIVFDYFNYYLELMALFLAGLAIMVVVGCLVFILYSIVAEFLRIFKQ